MESFDLSRQTPTAQSSTRQAAPVTTVEVSEVTPASTPLSVVAYRDSIEALLTNPPSSWDEEVQETVERPAGPVEACSRDDGDLVAGVWFHPVVAAIHLAFAGHRPLVLSPDMLWLLVAQGFANHLNNPWGEALRPELVEHQGKATIAVRRDDFVKGSPANPWPEVFAEFSGQIREHVGAATHDLLLPRFSTTGPIERAAAEIVLLDAMQSFFSYEFETLCGIPQIVLEGSPDDWAMLAERTRGLRRFALQRWTETLAPILDEFVAASSGRANVPFWRSIYKVNEESGGPYVSGWITAFFPYLKDLQRGQVSQENPWLAAGGAKLQELLYPPETDDPEEAGYGPTTEALPSGLARAPFRWDYLGESVEMEFLGGFVGVRQEAESLRLRPEIGWAVREQAAG